jgi:hypothetical protein
MKVIFTFICWCFALYANAQRCGTTDYIKQHSLLLPSVNTSSNAVISGRDTLKNEVIVVPVIIHVLYHTSIQNISDEQVLSQLAVLNNDYRRLNADNVNAPEPFKNIAGDTRIVFCLAKMDPNGRSSSGIIHKYTKEELFLSEDGMKFSSSGGDDGWDSKKYLNIWVCNLFGRTLGYSVLPGGDAARDGVVIQYNAFGTIGTVATPFNKGRTTTHEVGHWLGLRHLWGDALCGDDGINDTPPQQTNNNDCPAFPHLSSCSNNSNGDMFMNYMDFTDDACMNMFTEGQKRVMRSMFALGSPRNSFLNSSVCDSSLAQGGPLPVDGTTNGADISVYPNPFSNLVTINYKNVADIAGKTIKIYDVTGKLVFAQIIKSQKVSVALNNLPNGMYFLKIEGRNKPLVFKLIKQSAGNR